MEAQLCLVPRLFLVGTIVFLPLLTWILCSDYIFSYCFVLKFFRDVPYMLQTSCPMSFLTFKFSTDMMTPHWALASWVACP